MKINDKQKELNLLKKVLKIANLIRINESDFVGCDICGTAQAKAFTFEISFNENKCYDKCLCDNCWENASVNSAILCQFCTKDNTNLFELFKKWKW